jgi:hypothetical protein
MLMRTLLLIAVLTALGCGKKGGSESQAGKSDAPVAFSDNWSHKDVADLLAKKGIKVEIHPYGKSQGRNTLAYWFFDGNSDVLVRQCESAETAAQPVGSMGDYAFSKGRFLFEVDSSSNKAKRDLDLQLLKRIKTALSE